MIDKKIEATIKLWRPIFYSKPYYNEEEIQEWVDEIKSLFQEYAMEIINTKVKSFGFDKSSQEMGADMLRAEQREKLLKEDKK